MDTCDVLVVGGGPAGSSCARALHDAGLDVLVVDRAVFPRDKVCAGWITPQVVDDLDFDCDEYRAGRTFQPITGFRTGVIGGTRELETRYEDPVSFGIRRCEFDQYLLQRSHARVAVGTPVSSILRDGPQWIVNESIRAAMLVGTGGHFCPVARCLNQSIEGASLVVAQETEIPLDGDGGFAVAPEIPELYFCRDLKGYGWCFRKGQYVNIGIGRLDGASLPGARADFVAFLERRGRIPASDAWQWRGHAYLIAQPRRRHAVDTGVLLAGDAAGVAYPQSGEGIRPAVESGLLAASTIVEAGGRYTRERLEPYEQKLRERFGVGRRPRLLPPATPRALATPLLLTLLRVPSLVRHLLLDRWFLRSHEPALTSRRAAATVIFAILLAVAPGIHAQQRDASCATTGSLWVDGAGRPNQTAREALALLGRAGDEGLDAADYDASRLAGFAATLDAETTPATDDVARFETTLTAEMLRYLRDLHMGRIDPRTIGFRLNVAADRHDFPQLLSDAVARNRLTQAAADLRPAVEQYDALRAMLARYRSLAAEGDPLAWRSPVRTVHPGERFDDASVLHRRLVTAGDLPADALAPSEDVYDGALVEGVKRFQVRHGLEPDGVLGMRTHAALRVPLAWRVRQIELALERLRWLPHVRDDRLIVLNIPMFRLWGWDAKPRTDTPLFGMDVIVGRALSTQTPVFAAEIREVIFRPYWNVPPSILRNEVLPALARDPDYLRRHDMEIVRGPGDDARRVGDTPENVALVRDGTLRIRQRPGPRNSLGLIKFVFPNDENVYMHGTPAQELFSRERRDFSHGCVRVEDPVSLAVWALKDKPDWNREQVLAATTAAASTRVGLSRPIQVILFYTTAAVTPEDGTARFADDIYRHDARLDRALRARRRTNGSATTNPGNRQHSS